MLNYRDTQNVLHTRLLDFSLQEYLFVLQTVLGEDPAVAYASIYDKEEFKRNVPSENEEEYLAQFAHKADIMLQQQACMHLREYLEREYQSEIQAKASSMKDFKFTGSDIQQLLANLLHNRVGDGSSLDDASVKDVISLIKGMYDSGALDSGDQWSKHFITIPNKYNTICPNCNREAYAVEGLDFRCEFCGHVAKWSESDRRFYPQLSSL